MSCAPAPAPPAPPAACRHLTVGSRPAWHLLLFQPNSYPCLELADDDTLRAMPILSGFLAWLWLTFELDVVSVLASRPASAIVILLVNKSPLACYFAGNNTSLFANFTFQ